MSNKQYLNIDIYGHDFIRLFRCIISKHIFLIIKSNFLLLTIRLFTIKKIVGVEEQSQCLINLDILGFSLTYTSNYTRGLNLYPLKLLLGQTLTYC